VAINVKKKFKPVRTRSYLNKDFDAFRAELLQYARTFFPQQIQDFSEASVGGMFLDFVSFVGDTMSYYLDHQFAELSPETAVETLNIQRMLRAAGIQVTGTSPATVDVDFLLEVPAVSKGGIYVPNESGLPVIKQGTLVQSQGGVTFELMEDVDFAKQDKAANYIAKIAVGNTNTDGTPITLILTLTGQCISGTRTKESFGFSNTFVPFRSLTLSKPNTTAIMSVKDIDGNNYYEVEALTQDSIFQTIISTNEDNELVPQNVELIPAPYRFTAQMDINTKRTKLQFGSGDATTLDDDIVPDPSQFAVPLYGKKTFTKFSINPGDLLKTRTLGISPMATTINVEYRYGGGLSHNVPAGTIRTITSLIIKFENGASTNMARTVQASLDVINMLPAGGGENAPTLDDLSSRIPAARNAQSRIVTKEDLVARVYTMPSSLGRVFRAGIRSNPINPLATQLFIISRDISGNLTISPDSLKENLVEYLNQFRMISDAIDILDTQVVNLQIRFQISVDPRVNKSSVVQEVIVKLKTYFNIFNFQIDQPIPLADLNSIIFNTEGVLAVMNLKLISLTGDYKGRSYSDIDFDPTEHTIKGLIIGPPGSIFEVRYPDFDIIGSAV